MSLRLDMQSPDCVTETSEELKIDFDQLQQELSADIVERAKKRYRMQAV